MLQIQNLGSSSWTEVNDLNASNAQEGGSGTQTSGLGFGGATGPTSGAYATTEFWNGSSWTEVADLSTARMKGSPAPAGSSASTLFAGGSTDGGSTIISNTEEWNVPQSNSTITVS